MAERESILWSLSFVYIYNIKSILYVFTLMLLSGFENCL